MPLEQNPYNPEEYRPNVGICLVNDQGLVFAAQRIDTPGPFWQMPQGGIDPSEPPLQAALRELKEEIGTAKVNLVHEFPDWYYYDLPKELQGKLWGGHYKGQRQKWFVFEFMGSDADINLETSHPEFSVWAWMLPQDLLKNVIPFKEKIYQEVLKILINKGR